MPRESAIRGLPVAVNKPRSPNPRVEKHDALALRHAPQEKVGVRLAEANVVLVVKWHRSRGEGARSAARFITCLITLWAPAEVLYAVCGGPRGIAVILRMVSWHMSF